MKVVDRYRFVEESKIQIYDSLEAINGENLEIFEIVGGEWQPFFELPCPLYSGIRKIVAIQRAFKRKCYDCKVTGVFDAQIRVAILPFQRDINWPQCCLGNEFLLVEKILSPE